MEEDIRIIIENKPIVAHKKMLVDHSQYFEAMFQDHFREGQQQEIKLHAVKFDIFQLILEMIKADKTEISRDTSMDTVVDILKCSNMLQFTDIQHLCAQYLVSKIDNQTCWTILEASDLVQDQAMVSRCENYILWHFKHCRESLGLSSLSPDLLVRVLSHQNLNISSEMEMVQCLVRWCATNQCKHKLSSLVRSCIYTENLSSEDEKELSELGVDVSGVPNRRRYLPVVPCVVGHANKSENKPRNPSERVNIL